MDPVLELAGTVPHRERNEHTTTLVIIPKDTDLSPGRNSPFSQSVLNHALSRWQSLLQRWFEEANRRDTGLRSLNRSIRDWSFVLVEQTQQQRERLNLLKASTTRNTDIDVFVCTEQLTSLLEDSKDRMKTFVRSPFFTSGKPPAITQSG